MNGNTPRRVGTFHDLRKTFGDTMAEVVPMNALKTMMGHRDIATTAKHYCGDRAHAWAVRAAADRMTAGNGTSSGTSRPVEALDGGSGGRPNPTGAIVNAQKAI